MLTRCASPPWGGDASTGDACTKFESQAACELQRTQHMCAANGAFHSSGGINVAGCHSAFASAEQCQASRRAAMCSLNDTGDGKDVDGCDDRPEPPMFETEAECEADRTTAMCAMNTKYTASWHNPVNYAGCHAKFETAAQCEAGRVRAMCYLNKLPIEETCADTSTSCPSWANKGYCESTSEHHELATRTCPLSCQLCTPAAEPKQPPGQIQGCPGSTTTAAEPAFDCTGKNGACVYVVSAGCSEVNSQLGFTIAGEYGSAPEVVVDNEVPAEALLSGSPQGNNKYRKGPAGEPIDCLATDSEPGSVPGTDCYFGFRVCQQEAAEGNAEDTRWQYRFLGDYTLPHEKQVKASKTASAATTTVVVGRAVAAACDTGCPGSEGWDCKPVGEECAAHSRPASAKLDCTKTDGDCEFVFGACSDQGGGALGYTLASDYGAYPAVVVDTDAPPETLLQKGLLRSSCGASNWDSFACRTRHGLFPGKAADCTAEPVCYASGNCMSSCYYVFSPTCSAGTGGDWHYKWDEDYAKPNDNGVGGEVVSGATKPPCAEVCASRLKRGLRLL